MNTGLIPLTPETEELLGAVGVVPKFWSEFPATTMRTPSAMWCAPSARGWPNTFRPSGRPGECRRRLHGWDSRHRGGIPSWIWSHALSAIGRALLHKIITPYHGIPGKGSAFRTIFEIARRLKVKACAVVDSDLRSITPEWMELLLHPIINEGYDYVAPYYRATSTTGPSRTASSIRSPAPSTGTEVRQPIGGDFGFSGRLAEHYLEKHVWESDVARFGIDIWMTTEAVTSGARVCQSFLGAKIHDPKDPAADLSSMLRQVVGALFALMEAHAPTWIAGRQTRARCRSSASNMR